MIRRLLDKLYIFTKTRCQYVGASNYLYEVDIAKNKLERYYPRRINSCCDVSANYRHDIKYNLSIIMPVYNVAKYLRRCFDSILSQNTNYTYEIIVVYDTSKDASVEIVNEYKKYSNITIVENKYDGLAGARNCGIELAQGEYIMFMDSDDSLCESAIEKLMSMAYEKNADVVAGNYYKVLNKVKRAKSFYKNEKVTDIRSVHGFAWGKIYRTELFDKLRFPNGAIAEDAIIQQILFRMTDSIYVIEDYVYNYINNPNGLTNSTKANPRTLDSLYNTILLLEERHLFGLSVLEQTDYEYFLSMVKLTKYRTEALPCEIKKCIFVLQIDMMRKYFAGFKTKKHEKVENVLKKSNFKNYLLI